MPHSSVCEAEEQAHVLREAVVVVGHEVAVLRRGHSLALAQPAAEEENGPERVVQRGRLAMDINNNKKTSRKYRLFKAKRLYVYTRV